MARTERTPLPAVIQEARQRGEKWCRSCRFFQPFADFGTDVSRSDRLRDHCKEADREKGRRRYAAAAGDTYRPWLRGGPEEQAAREAVSALSCDSPLPEFITRKAAAAAGLTYYFDGRPCQKGHLAKKIVASYACSECHKAIAKRWEAKGPPHPARLAALEAGEKTYQGSPCPSGHDGLRITKTSRCIRCARENTAGWKAAHPDYDATGKTRERRRKDPTKHRAASNKWAKANPDTAKAILKRWRKKNSHRFTIYAARRRSRKAQNGGRFTLDDIAAIMKRQDGRCLVCGADQNLEIDHRMPVLLGGSDFPENLQILCHPCNASKGAKHPDEWLANLARRGVKLRELL